MLFVSALCLRLAPTIRRWLQLKRDTDAVELTYNSGATTQISVRYAGSWSARVECTDGSGAPVNNWFSVSPDNGVGNGRDYQWVTVTAERNPGDKRTGYIYLKPANGEEDQDRGRTGRRSFLGERPRDFGDAQVQYGIRRNARNRL